MENSEFKPVKLRLKIDLVSYPARAEGLVNMDILMAFSQAQITGDDSWYRAIKIEELSGILEFDILFVCVCVCVCVCAGYSTSWLDFFYPVFFFLKTKKVSFFLDYSFFILETKST